MHITTPQFQKQSLPLLPSPSRPASQTPPPNSIQLNLPEFLQLCTQTGSSQGLQGQLADGRTLEKVALVTKDIAQIVAIRKDMEKALQWSVLQNEHLNSLSTLIAQNASLQNHSNQLGLQLKQAESFQLKQALQAIKTQNIGEGGAPSQLEHKLEHLLRSFKDSIDIFEIQDWKSKPQERQTDVLDSSFCKNKEQADQGKELSLQRELYRSMFKEVMLREELISQREGAFYEYQTSQHELVEALLSDKEKDRTLFKLQKEKYQQQFRERHSSDIQFEQLTHHQSALTTLFEDELLLMKKKHQNYCLQTEDKLKQFQKLTSILRGQLSEAQNLTKKQEAEIEQLRKQQKLFEEQGCSLRSLKESLQDQVRALKTNHQNLLEDQKIEMASREEVLQSQVNAGIIRISQLSQQKLQLSKQLQLTIAINSKLEGKCIEFEGLLQGRNRFIEDMAKQIEQKNEKYRHQFKQFCEQKFALEQKVKQLQNQVNNLILSNNINEQRVRTLTKQSQEHQRDEQRLRKRIQQLEEREEEKVSGQDYSRVREAIIAEVQKQLEANSRHLDETVGRLSFMLLDLE